MLVRITIMRQSSAEIYSSKLKEIQFSSDFFQQVNRLNIHPHMMINVDGLWS